MLLKLPFFKKTAILCLITLLLSAVPSFAQTQFPCYGTVTKNAVNVRKHASASSDPIGRLKNGEIVMILGLSSSENSDWYKITFEAGSTGFVRSDLIKLAKPTPSPVPTSVPTPMPTAASVFSTGAEFSTKELSAANQIDDKNSTMQSGTEVQFVTIINEKERIGLYSGELQNGLPHGDGTFVTIDELKPLTYRGHWENGRIKGAGYIEAEAFLLHLQTSAEGFFDKTGKYVGEVLNGLPEGFGRFDTVNSKGIAWYYEGDWKAGLQNGNGIQKWDSENIAVNEGTFRNGDFVPNFIQMLNNAEDWESVKFSLNEKSISFLEKHANDYFAPNMRSVIAGKDVNHSFDLAQFKKKPSGYNNALLDISGLSVNQVMTISDGGSEMELMILTDKDGTLYFGFHFGPSSIVENMRVRAHLLPLDYSTYQNVEGTSLWAVFCAITNDIQESYQPLYRGDKGQEVLNMKFRLQELGYFTAGAGLSDAYNNTCAERVKQFQAYNNLPETGTADEETLSVLFSSRAVRKPY